MKRAGSESSLSIDSCYIARPKKYLHPMYGVREFTLTFQDAIHLMTCSLGT